MNVYVKNEKFNNLYNDLHTGDVCILKPKTGKTIELVNSNFIDLSDNETGILVMFNGMAENVENTIDLCQVEYKNLSYTKTDKHFYVPLSSDIIVEKVDITELQHLKDVYLNKRNEINDYKQKLSRVAAVCACIAMICFFVLYLYTALTFNATNINLYKYISYISALLLIISMVECSVVMSGTTVALYIWTNYSKRFKCLYAERNSAREACNQYVRNTYKNNGIIYVENEV